MEPSEAREYLQSLINKTMRIQTTDTRIFIGVFKCTDPQSNIVLAVAYEYRRPSAAAILAAANAASSSSVTVKANMTSRFLGLIVVPGKYITKMKIEG